MVWSEKVLAYLRGEDHSASWLARKIGVRPDAIGKLLQSRWHSVSTACRLARHLGVTVEYLMDPAKPWPPPAALRRASFNDARLAIEALARLGRADLLARIACGLPIESALSASRRPAKRRRRKPLRRR